MGLINRIINSYNQSIKESKMYLNTERAQKLDAFVGHKGKESRTEITFDFHRLSILVLRTHYKGSNIIARKVGTVTVSEAKIYAVTGDDVFVTGSLGGVQVIDVTPEGVNHQRILSVGKDPLTDFNQECENVLLSSLTSELYKNNVDSKYSNEVNALTFDISKDENSSLQIKVRMASVWYTHSPNFLSEIFLCISQFTHYLK